MAMSDLSPTYVFADDGSVTAFHLDVKIAGPGDFSSVEKSALDYLDEVEKHRKQREYDANRTAASHITTPNGLHGEILGRIPTVWGEEVTVRLENGRISRFHTHGDEVYTNEKTAAYHNDVDRLRGEMDQNFDHDVVSLKTRISSLAGVRTEVARIISKGTDYVAENELHKIAMEAQNEQLEIRDIIAHLESSDAEAYRPPAPFDYGVIDQASLGRAASQDDWLGTILAEMEEESNQVDFDKLINEGPGVFTSHLETGTLADAGSVREMAYAHVTAKTAGFTGEKVDEYRDAFVAKTELARKAELADRQSSMAKEAAVQEQSFADAPDEALFG